MSCPLCRGRKARRACPALGYEICPVCCGTKRLTEIACPADCVYLATSRDHPPAIEVRRRQRDLEVLFRATQDMSEIQSQLLLLTMTFLARYETGGLHQVIDQDIVEAVGALASTYETATRGVIYDHRPASLPAERLLTGLKQVLTEARGNAGTRFDRDVAAVLRRIEESARAAAAQEPGNRQAFVEWVRRVTREARQAGVGGRSSQPEPPRLIVP
jgi:hypothetical protein